MSRRDGVVKRRRRKLESRRPYEVAEVRRRSWIGAGMELISRKTSEERENRERGFQS